MNWQRAISVLCFLAVGIANAEETPSLTEEIQLLKNEIRDLKTAMGSQKAHSALELREENMKLKEEMSKLKEEILTIHVAKYAAGEVFDCSNTESSFTGEGVLSYNLCSVDTTLDSPRLRDGYFQVSQEGIYRLSFMGHYFIPPVQDTAGLQPYGMALLLLDIDGDLSGDLLLARSFLNPIISDTAGYFSISMETIQQLSP